MYNDSEHAGGSRQSQSEDTLFGSLGNCKTKHLQAPQTGATLSLDDLDKRDPPSPSDCDLNDLVSESAN